MQWAEMPERVRSAVEDRLGSRVVSARSQAGGFSPGVAARLELADGTRVFVKAVCPTANPDSPDIHRREARIAAALPPQVPAPALRWSWDDGDWVVLAFDDVDGRPPELPWRADELERVLAALLALARGLTPSPIALEPARDALGRLLGGWRRIADAETPLPPDLHSRLPELVEIESLWPASVRGDTLVHLDLRADNVLLTPDRVFVVDWPWAAIGAPWLDLVAMLPSVAMQGGPAPDDIWRNHPLRDGVDDQEVDAFVAALAGFFVHAASLPAPPGLPTLRPFQAGQGEQAIAWLARRRGWPEFDSMPAPPVTTAT
jgi:Phosphotransferase enzyme family